MGRSGDPSSLGVPGATGRGVLDGAVDERLRRGAGGSLRYYGTCRHEAREAVRETLLAEATWPGGDGDGPHGPLIVAELAGGMIRHQADR